MMETPRFSLLALLQNCRNSVMLLSVDVADASIFYWRADLIELSMAFDLFSCSEFRAKSILFMMNFSFECWKA